jgi:D-lactate dehydrogenase (cytochrome)
MFLIDESDDKELANAKALATRMARRALRVGGTCTGEHGVGRGKIDLLVEEYGPIGIETMLNIKRSIDPHNIMNPGIIFHC